MGTTAHIVVVGDPRLSTARSPDSTTSNDGGVGSFPTSESQPFECPRRRACCRFTRNALARSNGQSRDGGARVDCSIRRCSPPSARPAADHDFAQVGGTHHHHDHSHVSHHEQDAATSPATNVFAPSPCPTELSIDPGGIGKGLAAHLVATELTAAGATASSSTSAATFASSANLPNGATGTSRSTIPRRDGKCSVGLLEGAVATSSRVRRRWTTGAGAAHHLIDPRTGGAARSVVRDCGGRHRRRVVGGGVQRRQCSSAASIERAR